MSESRIHIEGLKSSDIELLKNVAQEAADQAVRKTLIGIGIDIDDPRSAQADMIFLRYARERRESLALKAVIIILGVLIVSGLGVLWIGLKGLVALR